MAQPCRDARTPHSSGQRHNPERGGREDSLAAVQAGAPFTFILLPFVIVVAGAVYDRFSRRRVHRVWMWGRAGLLIAKLIPLPLMGSGRSLAFARFMAGLALH